jgi:hypothetical protein
VATDLNLEPASGATTQVELRLRTEEGVAP